MLEKMEVGKFYEIIYGYDKGKPYTVKFLADNGSTGSVEVLTSGDKKWSVDRGAITYSRLHGFREVTELYARELIKEETNRAAKHLLKEEY